MFIVKYQDGTVEEYTVIRGLQLVDATITTKGKIPTAESTDFIRCKFVNIRGVTFDGCAIKRSVFQCCNKVRLTSGTRVEDTTFVSSNLNIVGQVFRCCEFRGCWFEGAFTGSFYDCGFKKVEIDHIGADLYFYGCSGIAIMSSLGVHGRNVLCYSAPNGTHFHIGCFRGNILEAIRNIEYMYETSAGVGKAYVASIKALYLTVKGSQMRIENVHCN